MPPMLHRFKDKTPMRVAKAAQRVISHYGGDASNIWNDFPTAIDLQNRLAAFAGIGQKKAAMAVEMLERDFGVAVRGLEGGDIAYDVHVRRVMLRTGLAGADDLDEMIESARRLCPDRPGSLDYPIWDIGRRWCRPQAPECDACRLATACPRHLDRSRDIQGIGSSKLKGG